MPSQPIGTAACDCASVPSANASTLPIPRETSAQERGVAEPNARHALSHAGAAVCSEQAPYHFIPNGESDWMAKFFFTGARRVPPALGGGASGCARAPSVCASAASVCASAAS
eukprot:6157411-Pleurochrysis_carterae.AAC.1